jgi:hypothetical protein
VAQPKSAAQAIWGNLPSGERPEVKQRQPSLQDALWPALSREAKQRGHDQALWDRINEHNRQVLLRNLRETRLQMKRR